MQRSLSTELGCIYVYILYGNMYVRCACIKPGREISFYYTPCYRSKTNRNSRELTPLCSAGREVIKTAAATAEQNFIPLPPG